MKLSLQERIEFERLKQKQLEEEHKKRFEQLKEERLLIKENFYEWLEDMLIGCLTGESRIVGLEMRDVINLLIKIRQITERKQKIRKDNE